MFTSEFSCYVIKKKHSNLAGLMMGLGISSLVFFLVLFFGADHLARNVKGYDKYFLAATCILFFFYFVIYFGKRFKINILLANNRLTLEVKDPSLPAPLIIQNPLSLKLQWRHQLTGRGAKMKLLYATVIDSKGTALVTFNSALGAIYEAPLGFEYIDFLDPQQRRKMVSAPLVYSTGKTSDIANELNIYLNYLDKKSKL